MKFFKELTQGRVWGHPIHSMLVHFPSALFPFSFILDLLALTGGNQMYQFASFYSLMGGVLGGIMAMIFGAIDLLRIESRHPAWRTAVSHGFLNVTWVFAFAIILGLKQKNIETDVLLTVISGLFNLGLIGSNYLGGELVHNFHIGGKDISD